MDGDRGDPPSDVDRTDGLPDRPPAVSRRARSAQEHGAIRPRLLRGPEVGLRRELAVGIGALAIEPVVREAPGCLSRAERTRLLRLVHLELMDGKENQAQEGDPRTESSRIDLPI
jgi:hypothetical protein